MSSEEPVEWPTTWAGLAPDRPAVIDVRTDAVLTYGALEARSRGLAHALCDWGLRTGDHVAMAMPNGLEFLEFCWAAQRVGLYWTPVNTHLAPDEARYMVDDCDARVLVVDDRLPELADALASGLPQVEHRIVRGGSRVGHADYEELACRATGPLPRECEGERMLYTSGTTGRPKGVARPLTAGEPGSVFLVRPLLRRLGYDQDAVLANFAPLYHAAPSSYGMGTHRLGGTVLVSGRFDAEQALAAMERHRATHGLFVPTMFARMLRMPGHDRYDLSALVSAAHGAAPCPVDLKRAMIDWWGPVLFEYYGGTEGAGMTCLDTPEWLAHPGSVGRPVGTEVHIVDEDTGAELGPGRTGSVYFSGGAAFRYYKDGAKTADAYDARGRSTLGDIGHVDAEGYLYLTDRRSFTVISGGVNVYPQEAEMVLADHPDVADVAAFGIPHHELGEQLVAVVEPTDPQRAGPETAEAILDWASGRLARYKLPRRIEFTDHLPRAENGKLYKRSLARQWSEHAAGERGRPTDC